MNHLWNTRLFEVGTMVIPTILIDITLKTNTLTIEFFLALIAHSSDDSCSSISTILYFHLFLMFLLTLGIKNAILNGSINM
jgi:hypothetical protein